MFTGASFRKKAAESLESSKNTDIPSQIRKFEQATENFTQLAQNEDWLAQNFNRVIHSHELSSDNEASEERLEDSAIAKLEEHILRCLGAAVIMQWNTIPAKLQRELFDTAGSLGDVLQTAALRGQIARFLHSHKDEATSVASGSEVSTGESKPDGA
jgi:hypothetical protein